ncbi:hypothetical protein BOX15_Mlig030096g2, partial [Macrostomum lignano]
HPQLHQMEQLFLFLSLLLLAAPQVSLSQLQTELTDSCLAYQRQLAALAANLAECSAEAARPFALCHRCAQAYASWTGLMRELAEYEQCSEYLLQSDSVQTLLRTRDFADSLWKAGGCKYCLTESGGPGNASSWSYQPDVAEFLRHVDQLRACFANYTQSPILPVVSKASSSSNSSREVCRGCKSIYRELNERFKLLGHDQQQCMDAVDALNVSRRAWGETLKCDPQGISLQPVPLIVATYLVAALFYIGASSQKVIKNRRLLRQKRVPPSSPTASQSLQGSVGA